MSAKDPSLSDAVIFIWAWLIVIAVGALIIHGGQKQSATSIAPVETVTHFERIIDGQRVQCERREDHVRGTTETAC